MRLVVVAVAACHIAYAAGTYGIWSMLDDTATVRCAQ